MYQESLLLEYDASCSMESSYMFLFLVNGIKRNDCKDIDYILTDLLNWKYEVWQERDEGVMEVLEEEVFEISSLHDNSFFFYA